MASEKKSPLLSRASKQQLLERVLGLRHKLRVNESGHVPQNHHEMAALMVANWELEDEIKAIEEMINASRQENSRIKADELKKKYRD